MSRLSHPVTGLILAALLVGKSAFAASAPENEPQLSLAIETIDGALDVLVKEPAGGDRRVAVGTRVFPGDTVVTGPTETVTLRSGDGAMLVLGRESRFELGLSDIAERAGDLGTGVVRGVFEKQGGTERKKSLRFVIRTRAGIFGVRGTDMVVSADGEQADLRTLKGTAEAAVNETALTEGSLIRVSGGHAVHADAKGVSAPAVFDRVRFSQEINQTQPALGVPVIDPDDVPELEALPGVRVVERSDATPPAAPPSQPPPPPESESSEPRFLGRFFQLSAGGLVFDQDEYVSQAGPGFHWNPSLRLRSTWLYLRGGAGLCALIPLEGFPTGWIADFFLGPSVLLFQRFMVDVGVRYDFWFGEGSGKGPAFSLGWKFEQPVFGFIERVTAGGGHVTVPGHAGYSGGKVIRFAIGFRI